MSVKVWMATSVWPEETSSAAGLRVWQWIRLFQRRSWIVALCCSSQANAHTELLRRAGVQVFEGRDVNDTSWDDVLRTWAPDVVWMDRFVVEEQWSWRAHSVCPSALRVLDTQDLHFLRQARNPRAVPGELGSKKLREFASILRSDVSLILSTFEKELLETQYSISTETLEWSPFAYPARTTVPREWATRKHVAFIGNYRHEPNLDAALFLVREIWPEMRKRLPAGTELHLMGAYMPKEISTWDRNRTAQDSGIRTLGWVENSCQTLEKYRLLVAPIRFGAGIKGKITDAWWSGTPVLTTSMGMEGLLPRSEPQIAIEGSVVENRFEQWGDRAAELYSEGPWNTASVQGKAWVRKFHDEATSEALLNRLEERLQNLAAVREKNLVGAILMEARSRWTQYFSKWIAEKSRR